MLYQGVELEVDNYLVVVDVLREDGFLEYKLVDVLRDYNRPLDDHLTASIIDADINYDRLDHLVKTYCIYKDRATAWHDAICLNQQETNV